MGVEGIGTGDTGMFEFKRDGGDFRVIGQGGCIERQDGAILFVGDIISQVEGGGNVV